jgi:hypothetical protein
LQMIFNYNCRALVNHIKSQKLNQNMQHLQKPFEFFLKNWLAKHKIILWTDVHCCPLMLVFLYDKKGQFLNVKWVACGDI